MDTSPSAKEEGSLLTTVLELAMKFVPMLLGAISGETGPSQTDRIEGIDLNVSYLHPKNGIVNNGELKRKYFRVRTPSP